MTYLLLRNNKESAPLSLSELRNMGLKQGDLVWVEGQSVCWLAPGEIQELKSLAGKPVKHSTENDQPGKSGLAASQYSPPEKSIAVTLPVQEAVVSPAKTVLTGYEPVAENDILNQQAPQDITVDDKVLTETKYSRPLDELKELYAKNLEQRAKNINTRLYIPPSIKKGAFYAGLLVAGIMVGFVFRNNGGKKTAPPKEIASSTGNTGTTEEKTPIQQPDTGEQREDSPELNFNAEPVTEMIKPEETALPPETVSPRETKPTRVKVSNPPVPVPEAATLPSKKIEKINPDAELVKDTKIIAADEMSSQVSVKSNEYDVGSFGGIRNLELTVTNTSKYSLDHVTVELRYLKPRDEFLKTENISFRSIPPNGSQTLAINKSNRGVKVVFKIIRIESKAISGNTAGL